MRKIIIYNICIFLGIFIMLEISIRIFNLANLVGIKSDIMIKDSIPYSYYPNKSSIIFGKKIFTDKYGFRVPKINFNYEGDSKVLILGDSTSYGVGVAEEKTFIGLIRKKFPNLSIFNTSITGHNINDHINIIKKYKAQFEVEKYIYFLNLNDMLFLDENIQIQNLKQINDKEGFVDNLKKNYFFAKANFFLRSKSALYVYVKSALTYPSKRHFETTYNFYKIDENLTNFEKKLDDFIKEVEKNENLTVVILPWEFQTRNNCLNKDLFLPQNFIGNYFKDKKINYVDFTNDFCKIESKNMFLKFDPAHLSKDGHKYVESLIIKNKLF